MERYVKCLYPWSSCGNTAKVGKIYKTNTSPNFSRFSWDRLLENSDKFIPATKEEYDLQEEIYVKDILVEDLSYVEPLIKLLNIK